MFSFLTKHHIISATIFRSAPHNKKEGADRQRADLNTSLSTPEHKATGKNICTETRTSQSRTWQQIPSHMHPSAEQLLRSLWLTAGWRFFFWKTNCIIVFDIESTSLASGS